MSFAGTVLDMIQRSKYNEELKRSNRLRRTKMKEIYLKHLGSSGIHHLKDSAFTAAEIELVKSKIRIKIKRERRISLIKSIVIMTALIFIILLLYFMIITK